MNKKIISFAIAFLLVVGLCSAGFAAWVITGSDSKNGTGNFEVDTVADERYAIDSVVVSTDTQSSNANVVYGGKQTSVSDAWLTNTEKLEDLALTITVKFHSNKSETIQPDAITVETSAVTCTDGDKTADGANGNEAYSDGYAKANKHGLVGELPTASKVNTIADSEKNHFTSTFTITFTWGSTFDNQNPIDYYNAITGKQLTDKVRTEAKTNLELLNTCLTGAKFSITVTVK